MNAAVISRTHVGYNTTNDRGTAMANKLFAKAKSWLEKPENRAKAKRAARTAYQKYKQRKQSS
ncbi:MAG: hypothetical protein WBL23_18600 [Salinisphaera sp.]|uniref:hypothetical protein n=1 Tax=Salinisphaera sp. TaxID=1914330 RepID=UPI003C7C90BC